MNDPVGIGLVGAGFLAETRARCYRRVAGQRVRLVAVCSRSRDRTVAFAARHRIPGVVDRLHELLDRPDVDALDLCVPNHLHRPFAVAAAEAGKHVLCTKPLAAYVGQDLPADADDAAVSARDPRDMLAVATGDATAMVEAAEHAGTILAYGENWVHAPAIVRAGELLRTARGSILEMHGWERHRGSHSPYSKTWRHAGGGALLRLGAHPIGAMLHLKDAEGRARDGAPILPISVSADVADLTRVATRTPGAMRVETGWVDVENWGTVIIAFADGSRGVAHGSDNHLGGMESRLDVLSSDCRLVCRLSPIDLLRAYAPVADVFGDEYIMEKVDGTAGWTTPMPDEDGTSGHAAMIEDFVDAVAEGRAPRADGRLGLMVTRVVYAAYVAAREGRRIELT